MTFSGGGMGASFDMAFQKWVWFGGAPVDDAPVMGEQGRGLIVPFAIAAQLFEIRGGEILSAVLRGPSQRS